MAFTYDRSNDDLLPYITDKTILEALFKHPEKKDELLHAADAHIREFVFGYEFTAEELDEAIRKKKGKTLTEWLNRYLMWKAERILNPEYDKRQSEIHDALENEWYMWNVNYY